MSAGRARAGGWGVGHGLRHPHDRWSRACSTSIGRLTRPEQTRQTRTMPRPCGTPTVPATRRPNPLPLRAPRRVAYLHRCAARPRGGCGPALPLSTSDRCVPVDPVDGQVAPDGQSAGRSVQVTSTVTVLRAWPWPWPTWSFWPATWMPPWLETRRYTRIGPWRRPMDWSLVGVKRSVVRPDAKVIADGAAAAPGRP